MKLKQNQRMIEFQKLYDKIGEYSVDSSDFAKFDKLGFMLDDLKKYVDKEFGIAQQEIATQVEKAKDSLQIKINALQLAILSIYKPKIESLERERGLLQQTCDEIRAKLKFLDYEQYHGDLAQSLNPTLKEINQLLMELLK